MRTVRYEDLTAADFLPDKPAIPPSSPQQGGIPSADPRVSLVLQIVKANSEGVTTSDIRRVLEATYDIKISIHPLLRILRDLEHAREVYSRSGPNTTPHIWYPNGRIVHPYLEVFREIRGKTYRATVQEARGGPAVQVQERSYSLLSGERVDGAVFVDYGGIDSLIELLQEIKARYESHEKVKVKI